MVRRNRLQLKILSLAMAAALLSGCAHRAPTEPTTTAVFQEKTAAPTETVVTEGAEDVKPAAEPFYNTEEVVLTPPEVKDPQGRKISSAMCQSPRFVGDRIITEVYIVYEDRLPDTDEPAPTDYYWAIFDLQGQYVGRFQNETMGVRPGFTLDEQGNIVAAFLKPAEGDGDYPNSLFVQKFDLSGVPISEEKKIYTAEIEALPYSDLICTDDLGTVIACGSVLIQLDKNDEILFREMAGDGTYFTGFLEENGQYYLQILSPGPVPYYGAVALEALSLDNDGILQHKAIDRNTETLIGMRVYETQSGVYCATRNAFGKLNVADGTFSTMFDWNQTDIDRSYLYESQVKVLSEGELSEPLLILPDNGVAIDPQPVPAEEPPATNAETTASEPEIASVDESSGERKTSILMATPVYTLSGVETHLIKVEPADENPHAGQDVIWVGGITITDASIMKSISSFNKDASNGIWVKVYDYADFRVSDDAFEEAKADMMAQINSGVGPDIVIGTDRLFPLDNHQVFTNLNGYMDGPSGINRDEFFDSAFRAFESDKKLYQIPLSFQAYAMLGSNEAANGRTDLNYKDYVGLRLSLGTDAQIIDYKYTVELLNMYIEGELSSWIDYANNKVSINKSSLEDMFSQLKLEVEASDEKTNYAPPSRGAGIDFYYSDDPVEPYPFFGVGDLYTHKTAFCMASVNSLSEFSYKEMIPGEFSWYGYPGSTGCTPIITSRCTAGIPSYSTQKDKAWEVIKYMLSEDMQYSSSAESAGLPRVVYSSDVIPVNVEAFRKLNKESAEKDTQLILGVPEHDRIELPMDHADEILDEYEMFLRKPLRRQIRDKRAIAVVRMYFAKFITGEMDISEAANTVEKEIKSIYEK